MYEKSRYSTAILGNLPDGRVVTCYKLVSPYGVEVWLTDWGATVMRVLVPDKNNDVGDVVLGYENLEGYLNDPYYLGATIGRVAGRIRDARYWKSGKRYELTRNVGNTHLHGGNLGWSKRLWEAFPFETAHAAGVVFRYQCMDGAEGYPGNVIVSVRYVLLGKTLRMVYEATSDQETPVNITNHAYFNLKDGGKTSVETHKLFIRATHFLPLNEAYVPDGSFMDIGDTPFDFTKPRKIGKRIFLPDEQLKLADGLDHCFVLQEEAYSPWFAATLFEKTSGRNLDVFTTYPGLQCYTGNFLDGSQCGWNGVNYLKHAGISLETQFFPDSPNQTHFPSIFITPEQPYRQETIWRFNW
ncbi:MAG: galactose mutarotase [Rhodothermia bacterium]|nr:galactose mutarotase [Rhodothermia bacterium]